jgi:hypothetical protein
MNTIGGKISGDYGWEVTIFHKLRETSDGAIFFDGKINWIDILQIIHRDLKYIS